MLMTFLLACAALSFACGVSIPPHNNDKNNLSNGKRDCDAFNPANIGWKSWSGNSLTNDRHPANETAINADNVEDLEVKWVYETSPLAAAVSMTPTVADGIVYGTDVNGNLFALNAETGVPVWARSLAEIVDVLTYPARTSPLIIGDWIIMGSQITGPVGAYVTAINRHTAELVWNVEIGEDPSAIITSSPVHYENLIYVGVSTSESLLGSCCSFRGSVYALDVCTGAVVWSFFMIPDGPEYEGYKGIPIWGSQFPIDTARNAIYVATGNTYTVPDSVQECEKRRHIGDPTCIDEDVHPDSIVALNLLTGAKLWSFKTIAYEAYHSSCSYSQTGCPDIMGPDYDISQSPIMLTIQRDGSAVPALAFGSKSGYFFVIDRNNGTLLWSRQVGPGSNLGGAGWGSAYDGRYIYTQSSNAYGYSFYTGTRTTSGSHWMALDPNTGNVVWVRIDPNENAALQGGIKLSRALGPITVSNGVVFAGTTDIDGHMYAFDSETGAILWTFESGGSVNSSPAIVNGVLFWGSGYTKWSGFANNQLYAFALP